MHSPWLFVISNPVREDSISEQTAVDYRDVPVPDVEVDGWNIGQVSEERTDPGINEITKARPGFGIDG